MQTTTTGATTGGKLRALAGSARFSTRIWFDVLAPLAMLLVVSDGRPDWYRAVLAVAMLVLFHAGQTYYNDLADVEIDRSSTELSRSQRALAGGRTTRRDMALIGTALVVLSMVCAALLSWAVFAVMTVALVLVLGYNFEPVRFAGRPLATQVFWPVMWVMIYLISALAVGGDGGWGRGLWFLAFVVMFMGLGESITQDTRDADNDAAGGRRTTVVVYGLRSTTTFAFAAQVASLVPLVVFSLSYPMPAVVTVLAVGAVAVWLAFFFGAWRKLLRGFDKASARLTHVGSIYAFTAVNALVCLGALVVQ